MNHSGDAAEQVVRMALEGVDLAVRITGKAAKEVALLLLTALKSPDKGDAGDGIKLKGKERLNSMLKSGKELEIFSVKERDLRTFVREAKNYGIVYCVLRNSKQAPDGTCDILVKADDAAKVSRLIERFDIAATGKAKIESEAARNTVAPSAETPAEPESADQAAPAQAGAQPGEPEINDIDKLMGELLVSREGKAAPEKTEAERAESGKAAPEISAQAKAAPETPAQKRAARSARQGAKAAEEKAVTPPLANGGRNTSYQPPLIASPSGPSSDSRKNSEKPTLNKPSVKADLREIAAAIKAKEAEAVKREQPLSPAKHRANTTTTHTQPQTRRKPISKNER